VSRSLIVIDVQNDFADPKGSLYCAGGENVAKGVNQLAASGEYDLIVATQDWHPSNHVSFASVHKGKKPFETIALNYGAQTLWTDHCIAESWGAEFYPALDTFRFNFIVRKGANPKIDSYSAFVENDKITRTGLERLFNGGYDLDFAGIATDVCVYNSAIDALKLGNRVRVITDACAGVTNDGAKKAIEALKNAGGSTAMIAEVLRGK
jgi:nicotinamidase/pyrazinamidase